MSGLGMSSKGRAVALLLVQAALVLTIAGKYLVERKVCPRVWVRAAQYDPNLPLRGRYLALRLTVDACGLPRDQAHDWKMDRRASDKPGGFAIRGVRGEAGPWQWTVRPLVQDGKLAPVLASDTDRPELTDEVTLWKDQPCDRATLSQGVEYFIPDTAQSPFPPKPSQELWVEVTVPPMGPPRPIQLAIGENGAFTPLKLQ
jgi:hypothetical protein